MEKLLLFQEYETARVRYAGPKGVIERMNDYDV